MFKYLLSNVKFDNTYKNIPYFKNVEDRNNALINNAEFTETLHNFNFGNILSTSVVVNTYNFENYFILKDENDNNYRFYFVTNSEYLSVNQWRLSLELDVITMYINGINENTFADCVVHNAHCNRFVYDDQTNKYNFYISNDSPIIQKQNNLDTSYTINRNKVEFKYSTNTKVNDWLNDNINCWMYLYIDNNHSYSASLCDNISHTTYYAKDFLKYNVVPMTSPIECDYSIICIPIYKSSNIIQMMYEFNNGFYFITLDDEGLKEFYKHNNDKEFVYNIKLSKMPPIYFDEIATENIMFIEDNLTIISDDAETFNNNVGSLMYGTIEATGFGDANANLCRHGTLSSIMQTYNIGIYSDDIVTPFTYSFRKEDLKGDRNIVFEPKIISECYKITLRDSSNGEYEYNPLYIGSNKINTLYTEGLSLTGNNYYYRLESDGIISIYDEDNYNGIVNTVDYSLTIANNNLENFLSNNKNFLLLKTISLLPMLSKGDIVGASTDIVNTTLNISNLKNKVNSMRNTNNDILLNVMVNDGLSLYVDIDKARDVDIVKYYLYLYAHGYNIEVFDNPSKYINTRKYFNFIQCDLEKVNINVPDNVENKIKDIFRGGIRLWNSYNDMYNYTMENYEIYLDN